MAVELEELRYLEKAASNVSVCDLHKLPKEKVAGTTRCESCGSKIVMRKKNVARTSRSKTLIQTTIPNELIADILFRLPVATIYTVMRCVCRNWRNIIDDSYFADAHLLRSSSFNGLLEQKEKALSFLGVKYCRKDYGRCLRNATRLRPTWKKFFQVQYLTSIVDSCDGLLLLENSDRYCVINPITKQHVGLPLPGSFCDDKICRIAFAKSTKKYKVVRVYVTTGAPFQHEISILTVGVDISWRCITPENTDCEFHRVDWVSTISVGGFVYFRHKYNPDVFGLDVEDEMIHHIRAPNQYIYEPGYSHSKEYMKSGDSLIFVFTRYRGSYDLWSLVDPKSGDWRKLYQIELNGKLEGSSVQNLLCKWLVLLRPKFVLEDVVLFFVENHSVISHESLYLFYNVKTGESWLRSTKDFGKAILYLPSLVAV